MSDRKISWDYLSIEITRRCNLKCAHCFRGDAQEIDIQYETIDALLDKTESIYKLVITGGEPTLNIDGIRYFLESAKKRNVMISLLDIVTNGIIRNDSVIKIIQDFSAYLLSFPMQNKSIKKRIFIGISDDDFHDNDPAIAIQNVDKPAIMSLLVELNGNKPLDYTTVGIDTSDTANIVSNIHKAHYELNNSSAEIQEYFASQSTPITDEERMRLYHKAVVTRLEEYLPVYNDLVMQHLSQADKEMWSLLYASYSGANRLYDSSLELLELNPDSEEYAQKVNTYQANMSRDFDRLVTFIRDHPIKS